MKRRPGDFAPVALFLPTQQPAAAANGLAVNDAKNDGEERTVKREENKKKSRL